MIDAELKGKDVHIELGEEVTDNLDVDLDSEDDYVTIDADLIGKDIYLEMDGLLSRHLNTDVYLGYNAQSSAIVHINTKEYWNSHNKLIGEYGHIYVYTNSCYDEGRPIPGIKIGDGISYLIDNDYVSSDREILIDHINDRVRHITQAEREFWNNKVRCDDTTIDGTTIIFTKR